MAAQGIYNLFIKRILDLIVSGMALLLLSPLLVAVAALIRIGLGSPVLFRQERPGFRARPFTLLKFRSMSEDRDAAGDLLPDRLRIGSLGRILRRFGLDETPELWNVLKGDMSLVGPRPLLMEYLERYTPDQMRRHEVRPGLTGWAIIKGRNTLSWEEKFALDLWYVEHVSLILDVKILMLTLWGILWPGSLTGREQVTTEKFTGSKEV